MNSKAPNEQFKVDIDKAIEIFSNISKCLELKWNYKSEEQCDHKCEECDYMYGMGNTGQIENAFENVQEWLLELKQLKAVGENEVDKQPTVYNTDKVVEELESLVKVTYLDTNGDTHLRYSMETILKAIEIVKAG